MKALKSIFLFLFALSFVSSCSHLGSQGKRDIASVSQEGSCNGSMRYLLLKRKRSQKVTSMIKAGDIDGLKNMFWSSHLVEREGIKQPYSRTYRKLRRLNQSTHVPALFQTKNKYVGDTDTFSTIIKIVDDSVEVDAEEAKAVEDVLGWITYVSGYKERFEMAIERGAETKIILDN
ncbi:MAG: hypothetical protein NXH75_14015, partial [Halobacteriovoraceae bacterium]|nr:hypothetical protein [Halobacteriovoraceae bacterium]